MIIEETVSDKFEVEAETETEAIDVAIRKYKVGDFVLEPGELQGKRVAIVKSDTDYDWIEF